VSTGEADIKLGSAVIMLEEDDDESVELDVDVKLGFGDGARSEFGRADAGAGGTGSSGTGGTGIKLEAGVEDVGIEVEEKVMRNEDVKLGENDAIC
jgi:hypothetical protein